ncbi:GTP cyclohydrolase II [Candidatus Heimdallarchaeota archaeon B3_Heim]|nr:MAG: GTP cyclohydrolase II [Candidatus Heimdallarchaeota archaeon B3_Heim]
MEKLSIEKIISQSLETFKNCPDHEDCENCKKHVCVSIVAVADFPSKYGTFKIIGFVNNKDKEEHIAIMKGDVVNKEHVLTRVHSSCLTGDALASLRCDCGPQLGTALSMIEKEGSGLVIYMQQEGRGIGLLNKLRAYALQDEGYDTYDANVVLGFGPDPRDYEISGEMLRTLGVNSVRLITNNPDKIKQLEQYIPISERVPLELPLTEHNVKYMETKKQRFGHYLTIFRPYHDPK